MLPIEQLGVGCHVLAIDENGEVTTQLVTTVFKHYDAEILEVETDVATLVTTRAHPIWMGGEIYRDAGDLKAGDTILRYVDGKIHPAIVSQLRHRTERQMVFNLEVETVHTFVASNFVVHNKVAPTGEAPPAPR